MADHYKRDEETLIEHLNEQLLFLSRSARLYDDGYLNEAKRMAVNARVLVHDTKNSHSLLKQLRKKDINFFDTAWEYDPYNQLPYRGLVIIGLYDKGADYGAILDEGPIKNLISFKEWWEINPIFSLPNGYQQTRKDIVLGLANREGGAHVDPTMIRNYEEMKRICKEELKIIHTQEPPFQTPYDFAAMRQITFEITSTLKFEFPELPTERQITPRNFSDLMGGMVFKKV